LEKKFKKIEVVGDRLIEGYHLTGLFIIGACILWATAVEVVLIFKHGGPSIKDILLLFIYLELGAMVGIYFKTKRMPVRFLIYIAITALTRVLAIDAKVMEEMRILVITGSILVLSLSVLVIKYGSSRLPSNMQEETN